MRKKVIPEAVFYEEVTTLITNLFIKNKNFTINGGVHNSKIPVYTIEYDIQRSAQMILDTLEEHKHLINLNADNTLIDWEKHEQNIQGSDSNTDSSR